MSKLIRAVTLLGIGLIGVTLIFVLIVSPNAEKLINESDTNRTVLVQFRDDYDFAQLNFVVADRGTKWFYLQSNLEFSTDPSLTTLGSSSQNIVLQSSLNRLNETYGIEVDDVWQIDKVAFASLVEAADGVSVRDPQERTLNGFEAVSYVFEATKNPEVILSRFRKIWRQVVSSFGTKELINVLTAIGSSSRSTIEQSDLAGYLQGMAKQRKHVIFRKTHLDEEFMLTFKSRKRLIEAGVRETLAP
jgi:hypothetical protein